MFSMDFYITKLYKEGRITRETAIDYATAPELMAQKLGKLKSVYLIATRDLSNLWLQFFLSQNQGFMRLFEKTVLK